MISEVLKQSTAWNSGFKKGDVFKNLNGVAITGTEQLIAEQGNYKSGEEFNYELIHKKK